VQIANTENRVLHTYQYIKLNKHCWIGFLKRELSTAVQNSTLLFEGFETSIISIDWWLGLLCSRWPFYCCCCCCYCRHSSTCKSWKMQKSWWTSTGTIRQKSAGELFLYSFHNTHVLTSAHANQMHRLHTACLVFAVHWNT